MSIHAVLKYEYKDVKNQNNFPLFMKCINLLNDKVYLNVLKIGS
jgi:hypothetical protein